MARAIDGEVAYRFLTEQLVKETGAFSKGVNKGLNIARSAMRNPDAIPTLTQPNEPLTLEQLQEMDGQPVWVEELNLWALVDLMYARGNELVMVLFGDGDIEVRNVELYNLHCYRRPPEEEV